MKKLVLLFICVLAGLNNSLFAQSTKITPPVFKPYWSVDWSSGGTISGSIGSMEGFMTASGFGGTYSETFWFLWYWNSTTTYPIRHKSPSQIYTLAYQYKPTQGLTANYGIVEEYTLTGHLRDGGTFDLQNKLSSASLLCTVSTVNQRVKASAGPSYSWMMSKSISYPSSALNEKPNVSGAIGLKMNVSWSFIRSKHFFVAYSIDTNISGRVRVGPYDTGSAKWKSPKLPISTLNHGISIGLSI